MTHCLTWFTSDLAHHELQLNMLLENANRHAVFVCFMVQLLKEMHSTAKLQYPPLSVLFICSCDKVDHKQEVCFLLYSLGHIVIG